jgi:hypothetical protein
VSRILTGKRHSMNKNTDLETSWLEDRAEWYEDGNGNIV